MTIAVCSWSLQPDSPEDLVEKVRACGLNSVQLALDPLRTDEAWGDAKRVLGDLGISIVSGMIATAGEDYSTLDTIKATGGVRSDEHWEQNLSAANKNAELAETLGLKLVTLHAGFLPHEPDDPTRAVMLDRLRKFAAPFRDRGIKIGFETGQETADTLLGVLDELDLGESVGVNFDPANMILYGMGDPAEALDRLLPHVVQVHIKDAVPTETPGAWGRETRVGEGSVDWEAFFAAVARSERPLDLCIEREAGGSRIDDIKAAAELIRVHADAV